MSCYSVSNKQLGIIALATTDELTLAEATSKYISKLGGDEEASWGLVDAYFKSYP